MELTPLLCLPETHRAYINIQNKQQQAPVRTVPTPATSAPAGPQVIQQNYQPQYASHQDLPPHQAGIPYHLKQQPAQAVTSQQHQFHVPSNI